MLAGSDQHQRIAAITKSPFYQRFARIKPGDEKAWKRRAASSDRITKAWHHCNYDLTYSKDITECNYGGLTPHQDPRMDDVIPATRAQDLRMTDGVVVGTFTPSGTSYTSFSTATFTVTAGRTRSSSRGWIPPATTPPLSTMSA